MADFDDDVYVLIHAGSCSLCLLFELLLRIIIIKNYMDVYTMRSVLSLTLLVAGEVFLLPKI